MVLGHSEFCFVPTILVHGDVIPHVVRSRFKAPLSLRHPGLPSLHMNGRRSRRGSGFTGRAAAVAAQTRCGEGRVRGEIRRKLHDYLSFTIDKAQNPSGISHVSQDVRKKGDLRLCSKDSHRPRLWLARC